MGVVGVFWDGEERFEHFDLAGGVAHLDDLGGVVPAWRAQGSAVWEDEPYIADHEVVVVFVRVWTWRGFGAGSDVDLEWFAGGYVVEWDVS